MTVKEQINSKKNDYEKISEMKSMFQDLDNWIKTNIKYGAKKIYKHHIIENSDDYMNIRIKTRYYSDLSEVIPEGAQLMMTIPDDYDYFAEQKQTEKRKIGFDTVIEKQNKQKKRLTKFDDKINWHCRV